MDVLLSRDIKESVLGGDLCDILEVKQVVSLYSIGFDVGLGVELYLVLLDLALFAHEEELLFGVVVESGEGLDFDVGFVD